MSANQITELQGLVKKQGEQIERLQDTIYYLLADIYPLQEEGNYIKIYSVYNHMKYDKFCNTRWLLDEDDDGSDEYNAFAENRSKEATRRAMEEVDDEDLSTSTHSSMPPLERVEISNSEDEDDDEDEGDDEDQDQDEDEGMPSLKSVSSKEENLDYYHLPPSSDEESNSSSSKSASKRMQNSAELCGNN
jgi:hypothetical protein